MGTREPETPRLVSGGTGECLISIATRPQVSEEILANCGVLISFKNHMQRSFLCELLNLEEENQDYLSILEEGQCIARVNSVKRPFLLWIPYIERHWIKRGEVNRKNKLILNKIKSHDIKKQIEPYEEKERSTMATQNVNKLHSVSKSFIEAAKIKYFIDNLEDPNKNAIFNPSNYRKCSECNSLIEIKYKICPYCGALI